METFVGPYCQKLDLKNTHLNNTSLISSVKSEIENGLILELLSYLKNINQVVAVLLQLKTELSEVHPNTLKSRVKRVAEIKKKLVSKKKVPGVTSIEELKQQTFDSGKARQQIHNDNKQFSKTVEVEKKNSNEEQGVCRTLFVTSPTVRQPLETLESSEIENSQRHCDTDVCSKDEKRAANLFEYELKKKSKTFKRVKKKIKHATEQLQKLNGKAGHYSVRNVNKRDERARKTLTDLKETRRQLLRYKRISEHQKTEYLKNQSTSQQTHHQELKAIENRKLNAQKSASYYKGRALKLKKKLKNSMNENDEIMHLKTVVRQKDKQIQNLEINIEILNEQIESNHVQTKNVDGSFANSIRMCVMELAGLEVACAKVSNVIKAVAKHLFCKDIPNEDLPTSSTVQTIVDEGHFIAKTFISEKLANAENWGICRDGTTRKKQKIVDTSITLSTGDIVSLGFSRVAHETSETIQSVTKDHIKELAELNTVIDENQTPENYMKMSLEKLAFTMSDRASNEKKADRLLDEWRDEVLTNCHESEKHQVLHFHCMAHVLLGFHRYMCTDLKDFEATMCSEHGKLGRDNLSIFKFWNSKGTAAERTLRTVSDVFGPSGDHHGVRDLWEAHCAAHGIKSIIGNYKDNRFNAIFQTAAEVFAHKDDFISVLQRVRNPNLKLKSVLADLTSLPILTVIQCIGLLYVKVTGPYWNLVISNKVPYLELYSEITAIHSFLEICENDPASILQLNYHWTEQDKYDIRELPHLQILKEKLSCQPNIEFQEVFLNAVTIATKAMAKTVKKQLTDFLPGGSLHVKPSEQDLKRTGYAHVTNLGCEHHFGDLDSSQRRRPSASFHHHSSIQLLKRSREKMMTWLVNMKEDQRSDLLKTARKGGKDLREKHRTQEQSVLQDIHNEMMTQPNKRQKTSHEKEKQTITVKENMYVAVAYQDSWYPGIVTKTINAQKHVVKFMAPTRKFGHFIWPSREDVQTVDTGFILQSGFVPNCINSGRMWQISETKDIIHLYQDFSETYF